MTRFVMAVRTLTIVPVPGAWATTEGAGAAAAWYPVVGLAIGAVLAVTDRAASTLFPPLVAAVFTVVAWALVTGGLHLDGLADTLDGVMGRDAAHRLLIMRDSRIGSFGAIGLVLFLLLEVSVVGALDGGMRWRALLVAPVVGRAMPPLLARLFPGAGAGQGAAFRASLAARASIVAAALALVIAATVLGPRGVGGAALALVVALVLGRAMTRRIGGVSGDVLGASVQLAELAVLLVAAAGARA